jgi:hypothetical protein
VDDPITTPGPAPRASKLDQARAKRQTHTTQAVAAAIAAPAAANGAAPGRSIERIKESPASAPVKPKSAPVLQKPKVKNFVLPVDVISRGNRRIAEFFDCTGRGLSWSGLAEVALLELLDRPDFDAVIERHGARARRPDVKVK